MARSNPVKDKLLAGSPALGAWMTWAYPPAAELLGLAGYDCLMIDHEHGIGGLPETLGCMQAVRGLDTAGLVRIPWHDPIDIKRLLDIGIDGIMVPSVSDADTARAIVSACRYPPDGIRGAAYGMVRAADYGLSADGYMDTIADRLLIICQIETVEGVEAIPDIAAVDGVDMLFVGPTDLSGSLGKLSRFDDPEVRAMVRRAERAVKDAGIWLGALPSLGRSPTDMVADGADLVLASSECKLLLGAAQAELTAFRGG